MQIVGQSVCTQQECHECHFGTGSSDLPTLQRPWNSRVQMAEEQEQEVNHETERGQDVELPPMAQPEKHHLHQDVIAFMKTGIIPPFHSGSAFLPVFETLEKSSAASHKLDIWSPSILAMVDFYTTIKPKSTRGTMNQYLQPVQWILSQRSKGDDPLLVLLSPSEVNHLLSDIRASEQVRLHMYAPRTSQHMKPSDDLKLYSIPPPSSD